MARTELVPRTKLVQMLGMDTRKFEYTMISLKASYLVEETDLDRIDPFHRRRDLNQFLATAGPQTRRLFQITEKGRKCVNLMNEEELLLLPKGKQHHG